MQWNDVTVSLPPYEKYVLWYTQGGNYFVENIPSDYLPLQVQGFLAPTQLEDGTFADDRITHWCEVVTP